jgi:hypothetical protein
VKEKRAGWKASPQVAMRSYAQRPVVVERQDDDVRLHEADRRLERERHRRRAGRDLAQHLAQPLARRLGIDRPHAGRSGEREVRREVVGQLGVVRMLDRMNPLAGGPTSVDDHEDAGPRRHLSDSSASIEEDTRATNR